jgi:hypothetical protein
VSVHIGVACLHLGETRAIWLVDADVDLRDTKLVIARLELPMISSA